MFAESTDDEQIIARGRNPRHREGRASLLRPDPSWGWETPPDAQLSIVVVTDH
jgi:hypothetical protein